MRVDWTAIEEAAMRNAVGVLIIVLAAGTPAFSQRPSDPALLVPQQAPPLEYVAVANPLAIPAGTTMGAAASVAFDSNGHVFVLNRGPKPFVEFDSNGAFVRTFGDPFTRAHGLRIDSDGNIWATDVGAHVVVKLNREGNVLLTLGTKGQAGAWDEAAGSRLLNQPNDLAIGRNGDIFVVQGHTPGPMGDPRVLKFDKTGKFMKSWGGKGKDPGKFEVAHGVAIDAKGLLWIADRENQRIQVFDQDGAFVRQMTYAGLPCSIAVGRDSVFMVNGFAGQLLKMDLDGRVLAAIGKPGTGLGEFGEAHFVAVSPKGDVYVADSVNGAVQKFVRK
jgi:DNA-binding beta-propeller fold protein YncE